MTRLHIAAGLAVLLAGIVTGGMVTGAAGAADLPDAIRQSGTLHLTTNSTYPPMEYRDPATNQLTGLDIELAEAIAKKMGVTITWTESPFDQLIPSLQTGRTDFIISGFSDRASRRETMGFVDYLRTGAQFFVAADSPAKVPADLCGLKIGTTRSTSYPGDIAAWSKQNCEAAGKPAVQYVAGENSIDVRNQLKQGRIDAGVQGSETLPYVISIEPGKYRILGEPFTLGYQGIAFKKDNVALRDAVVAALRGVIADGAAMAILTKYGLAANAVPEPLVNASPQ